MYQIDKEINLSYISKVLQNFQLTKRIKLNKYENYYDGIQEITAKTVTDVSKPCNKTVTNYCKNIVDNYTGYLIGKDISYTSNEDIKSIQDILNYNDVSSVDAELLTNALIYGVAYEIQYIDEDGKERFKVLDSKECIPIHDSSLNENLKYVIRYYPINTIEDEKKVEYIVEVYDEFTVSKYKTAGDFASFAFIESIPHYFRQVPISIFALNKKQASIFDCIISLQDAYNTLLSSEIDDFEAFCDAYLVLKGVTADAQDIALMKENRVLLLDAEAQASYLSKSISDTQIENMLRNINDNIHKIANSPDFSDEKLLAQSGIAMRYKLVGFENQASAIEKQFKKLLQRRFELLANILAVKGEDIWRDINIIFTRNLPINHLEIAQQINLLRGLVSDETLLTQLPFITDAVAELEKLSKQKTIEMEDYNFTGV